jgi:eight-cysteine-cluster-containing protein
MARLVAIASALLLVACASGAEEVSRGPLSVPPCRVAGCSGQVCTDRDDVVTTCDWLPEYACYRTATCAPQETGACGWTQTPELVACIEAARRR